MNAMEASDPPFKKYRGFAITIFNIDGEFSYDKLKVFKVI